MKSIEYELTYLAKKLPKDLKKSPSKILIDIYFPNNVIHPNLRLRQKGDKYELTKKSPINKKDASLQTEETIELTKEEFEALAKGDGKRLKKRRYFYEYEGKTAEIDVFEEELKGLVLIDFEFKNREEQNKFEMPDFCLVDITQEEFIAGGMLAGKSIKDIQKDLNKYNYKTI